MERNMHEFFTSPPLSPLSHAKWGERKEPPPPPPPPVPPIYFGTRHDGLRTDIQGFHI